jgi:hypothetical protein
MRFISNVSQINKISLSLKLNLILKITELATSEGQQIINCPENKRPLAMIDSISPKISNAVASF